MSTRPYWKVWQVKCWTQGEEHGVIVVVFVMLQMRPQESFDLPTSSGRLVGRTCAISCLAPQLSPRDTEVELALNSN